MLSTPQMSIIKVYVFLDLSVYQKKSEYKRYRNVYLICIIMSLVCAMKLMFEKSQCIDLPEWINFSWLSKGKFIKFINHGLWLKCSLLVLYRNYKIFKYVIRFFYKLRMNPFIFKLTYQTHEQRCKVRKIYYL